MPGLPAIHEIWVYLSGSPLLALILTLSAYQAGVMAYERAGRNPLANPVAIAVAIVAAVITAIDMPYEKYFEGAQFVHFLLGTATVALAVPIYKGLAALRGRIVPLLAALVAGGATSVATAVGIASLMGADAAIIGGFIPAAILQASDPNQSEIDFQNWSVLRRLGSVGILWNRASTAWLAMRDIHSPRSAQTMQRLLSEGQLTEARVKGIPDPLYLRRQDLPCLEEAMNDDSPTPQASFIAPLDNLMWDRRLVEDLFCFEYRWEVYTPPARRKYGYYVLPVLYGERFIARIEPALDKRSRLLTIKNWCWEPEIKPDEAMIAALAACFERFFHYLNASSILFDGTNFDAGETERLANILRMK